MKFSIITPTYKRRELLDRAVQSVMNQRYQNWEMIIVNDSPDDASYNDFTTVNRDPRIRYICNDSNRGVNYSRNSALDSLSADSDWTIFLDDDDYLEGNALEKVAGLAADHPDVRWLVTNRAYADGKLITLFPKDRNWYSYIYDCLLLKRAKGDATHTIATKLLTTIRFARHIKQAEEWIFYYELEQYEKIFYINETTTLSDGYDNEHGLNFRKRTTKEQLITILLFIQEGFDRHIVYRPTFMLYMCIRFLRAFLKK